MIFSDATRINPGCIVVQTETEAELSNTNWCRHLMWLDPVGLGFPKAWRGLWADHWPCSCLLLWRSPQSDEAVCGAAAVETGVEGCWLWWAHPAPPPAPHLPHVSSGGPSVRTWNGGVAAAGRRKGWCIPDHKLEGHVGQTESEHGSFQRHSPQGPGNLATWPPLRLCGEWRSAYRRSPECCSLCPSACFLGQLCQVPVCPLCGLLGSPGLLGRGSLRENSEM